LPVTEGIAFSVLHGRAEKTIRGLASCIALTPIYLRLYTLVCISQGPLAQTVRAQS
jgi:hypothetical protein